MCVRRERWVGVFVEAGRASGVVLQILCGVLDLI